MEKRIKTKIRYNDYVSCYISGQISGLSVLNAKFNFDYAERKLDNFSRVVNPLRIKPLFGIKRWIFYMIADLWKQSECTHTAFQSNWMLSRGAVIEYFFARFIFKQYIIWL